MATIPRVRLRKDLERSLQKGHPWLYAVGVITAGITAYYMFRLLFLTFFGPYRGDVDPSALGG